jgi:hypothetical protein
MTKANLKSMPFTNDQIIRYFLNNYLYKHYSQEKNVRIIEELGVRHGMGRIDFAVINGFIHGYEIKSDCDTLERLPRQIDKFNEIFDKLTLVVGKRHLYTSIHIIPEWWGIILAKKNQQGVVSFQTIRIPDDNKKQDDISIARLLWKKEALEILEQQNKADGARHKTREYIYKRLVEIFPPDRKTLKEHVSSKLVSRKDWRSEIPLVLNGD